MKLRFWYKVYGATGDAPSPLAMLNALRPPVRGLVQEFEPDDEQWRTGRFRLSTSANPSILVRRHSRRDDEFPEDLDKFAEIVEAMAQEPHRDLVIAHLRRTQQVIYLTPLVTVGLSARIRARICEQLCGILTRTAEGLIQVYQEGFFSPQGESLLPYSPRHRLQTT
jgi:hypothetical protein